MSKQTLKIRTYPIIERAVEDGVRLGWRRAHKHADKPGELHAVNTVLEAVMAALEEVIDFGGEDDSQ